MSILVQIFENLDFWSKFAKLSILAEIFENLDFGRIVPNKSRFWSTFSKNLDFGKKKI